MKDELFDTSLYDELEPMGTNAGILSPKSPEDELFLPAIPQDKPDIVKFLKMIGKGVYVSTIAIALNRNVPSLEKLLQQMKEEGIIRDMGFGLWSVPLEDELQKRNDCPKPKRGYRKRGDGTGYIIEKLAKGKYRQYWFCWEFYYNGVWKRRSKYIPKHKVNDIIAMNLEKKPVKEVLFFLEN